MVRTPPDVGAADASSAIEMPTRRIKKLPTAHFEQIILVAQRVICLRQILTPQTIADVPPFASG